MSRARATALILVNWKGVFFERYLLDRHVTALEGANGAGKTTVMIGAYVVLLPDLTRLKFTNLGETGATGGDKGIYGRLGEPGPSYAALEIEVDDKRLCAGVYLERKAAPALSLTPFIISNLPSDTPTHRIFLRESESHEHIATMADIEESVKLAQAEIEVFSSSKDYFASLFERGISPLRLALDEERAKFNDMLRTSMTGGISRTLTSDLRSFLFKQQTGLFDTLTRMRKNLDACRRTRIEVSEARVLEHEINGVYTAGHAMFEAALAASRKRAAEHRQAADRAAVELGREQSMIDELRTCLREADALEESHLPRLERARKAEAEARARVVHLTQAAAAATRLAQIEAERQRLAPEVEAAGTARAEAAAARERARAARDGAQQTLHRAASGLASLQAGLEELHRQAHAHRRVREQLSLAERGLVALLTRAETLALPEPSTCSWLTEFSRSLALAAERHDGERSRGAPEALTPELLADAIARARAALAELDRTRAERERRAEAAERRRRDHAEARAALVSLTGELGESDLAERARRELARLNELTLLGSRQNELGAEWQRLRTLAERQRAVRAEVQALGLAPQATARDFMHELTQLDTAWLAANEEQRELAAASRELGERETALRAARETLAGRAADYEKLAALARRISEAGIALPETRAGLNLALRACHDAKSALADRARELDGERRAALELAQRYEAMGGGVSAELVRLAELVEGQLLLARYEELEPDEARRVQAELGPLVNAIVVEDVERALPLLSEESHSLSDLWLLRAGKPWPESPTGGSARPVSDATEGAPVVVDFGHGVRISRLPSEVSLGRAARQRQAERARAEAETATQTISALETQQREQEVLARDLWALSEHWERWALGDPGAQLVEHDELLSSLGSERESKLALVRERRVDVARLGARREALRSCLAEHHLLDPPDVSLEAERAQRLLEQARLAARELATADPARRVLVARVHDLETPPDESSVDAWREQQPLLEAQRDALFELAEMLAVLSRERAALGWSDAARALAERTDLVPELEAQHQRALDDTSATQLAYERAEASWEQATRQAQEATARLGALTAHHARARGELGVEGSVDLSADALANAERERLELGAALDTLQREQSGIDAQRALARERLAEAQKRQRTAQLALEKERAEHEPSEAAWTALAAAARQARVLELDAALAASTDDAPSAQRWLEAESKRALCCDRLQAARGGAELALALARPPEDVRDLGRHYLALWLDVRAWLLRRLPAQIAELGQPLSGLSRLREDLGELEHRLNRQEGELRGTTADVARSIDVQLRRATAQVKRVSRALDGIQFGSIHGIRVQLARIEKMDQVLAALREGQTQELLFQSNLPIEEALDEIFRRHAGGRTGGHKLIDYREYLELSVQIQRRTAETWERVNPSQVSTGEAIGIGAALMMVILAEWERDDQLLRQKRDFGSLRFLFLDEANRLSQDNLGVLFDLCEVLDLQLLIAAPEVARAEGNTTYRLVRRVTEDGLEEVLVTGRRASLPEAPVEPEAGPAPPPAPVAPSIPEQLGLLQ
jgi:chromosome partition protein MukB